MGALELCIFKQVCFSVFCIQKQCLRAVPNFQLKEQSADVLEDLSVATLHPLKNSTGKHKKEKYSFLQ